MEKSILVVIDMQHEYIYGNPSLGQFERIVPKIKEKIELYDINFDLIFATQDSNCINYLKTEENNHIPLGQNFKDTTGWRIIDDFNINMFDSIFYKNSYGSPELIEEIQALLEDNHTFDKIELCGVYTSVCILANAILLRSFFPDIKIVVDFDCCADENLEKHLTGLELMKKLNIEVITHPE